MCFNGSTRTSVTGHKQGSVGFTQCKQLPRATVDSSVSVSSYVLVFHMMEAEPAYEMFCVRYKNKKTKAFN
jgi:hypothetical protein